MVRCTADISRAARWRCPEWAIQANEQLQGMQHWIFLNRITGGDEERKHV